MPYLAAIAPRFVSNSLRNTFLRGSFHAYFSSTTRSLAIDMETVNTTERLRELRRFMKENNVDIYGTVVRLFLNVESFLMPFKLCHLKTATNQSILLHVMPEEVRLSASLSPFTCTHRYRVHLGLLRLCWYSRHHKRKGSPSNRWPLFQSGF